MPRRNSRGTPKLIPDKLLKGFPMDALRDPPWDYCRDAQATPGGISDELLKEFLRNFYRNFRELPECIWIWMYSYDPYEFLEEY